MGHERIYDQSSSLIAPKDCKFREEGKFIILKVRGSELKYPRPDNLVTLGREDFKEGEVVCSAYNTTSPIFKLNGTLSLLRARGTAGTKYFEKDNVIISDCYALNDGIITYKENEKTGDMEVWIGSKRYLYSPESIYYFPNGAKISKFDRICSGIVDMGSVTSELGDDISGAFNIFRSQFYTLNSNEYVKSGVVSDSDMQEEILEIVFAALTRVDRNPKGNISEMEYQGTQRAILGRKSFFTSLSYGWSSKVIGKALRGEVNMQDDLLTETVLGLLLNDKLDKN